MKQRQVNRSLLDELDHRKMQYKLGLWGEGKPLFSSQERIDNTNDLRRKSKIEDKWDAEGKEYLRIFTDFPIGRDVQMTVIISAERLKQFILWGENAPNVADFPFNRIFDTKLFELDMLELHYLH